MLARLTGARLLLPAAGRRWSAFSSWEQEVEREALAAAQNKGMDGASGLSPGEMLANKVSREFQAEGAHLAKSQEDRLRDLLRKMEGVRGSGGGGAAFNALRKKALEVRQGVITQREAAGLSKNQDEGRKLIEGLFPIGGPV